MNVVCFCGASGVGKTSLMTGVIAALKAQQQCVSVIKHAHAHIDIDQPGKDSWRHGQAGAFEVLLASPTGWVKLRQHEAPVEPKVHALIAEMAACDWLLIEGFKHCDLMKIELWRAALNAPVGYSDDPFVVAVATDAPAALPVSTALPRFSLGDAPSVAAYLLQHARRFEYQPHAYR